MKFTIATVAGAMAGLVAGQVKLTSPVYSLTAGSQFTLTWVDASDPVTVYLEGGPSGNLVDLDTVASNLTGSSSYVYTPPSTLCANEVYAFKIVDAKSTNYSPQFSILGLSPCSSSTSSSTTATTSSTTSSTSQSSSWGTAGSSMRANSTTTASTSSTTMSTDAAMVLLLLMVTLGWHI